MKVKKGNNSAISIKSFIIITLFLVIFSSCFTSIPDDRGEESQGGSLFTSQSVKPNYTITSATSAKPEIKPFDGELFSRSVYVVDMNSGEVFLAVNEKEKMIPASTVKIMTALHTLDLLSALGVIDSAVEVPDEVFAKFETDDPNTVGGSMAEICAGQDNLTYRDCLYGLMLPSGNDAANVLAHNIGKYGNYAGSGYTDMEFFSEMMNEKAERIGCVNSNFTNAHGLLEADSQKPLELKNWSCAYDLAMIAKYAYENHEMFRELFGNSRYEMPANDEYPGGYVLRNSNLLVRVPTESEGNIYFREYAVGGKTGGLDEYFLLDEDGEWVEYGGIANLVSVADDGENTYITVTLEAPYKTGELDDGNGNRMSRLHYAYADHLAIYEWLVQ